MAVNRAGTATVAAAVIALALAAGALSAQSAAPLYDLSADRNRLREAKAQSAAAQARADALEKAAAGERDAAAEARTREAAVAARIQRAEADIAAAQARITIVRRLLDDQHGVLAARQGPIVRLIAALQSLARRPAIVSLVQPGSVNDLVHVRAVLGSVLPQVRARTADVRAALARTRKLEADAALAVRALGEGRARLDDERLALTRLEATHRLKSRALGRNALFESDRAIALGERARDIVDLMDQLSDDAQTRADLAALPGPSPRPPRPGEIVAPGVALGWSSVAPPYRLPVAGRVVTGLGELSDAGVRSRGLTIAPAAGAQVVAPAAGKVVFARRFRGYGQVVIIDHGGGWTSLVVGLGTVSVATGDQVSQGSPIGLAAAGEAPRVTVELRRRDRPIDMTRLLG